MLITGSALNGVAATGQFATNVTLGELVSNKQRGLILSIIYLVSIPFAAFSPVVARSWSSSTVQGWRWSYYLGIMLNSIALVLYYFSTIRPLLNSFMLGGTGFDNSRTLIGLVFVCLYLVGGCSWLVLLLVVLRILGQAQKY